MLVQLTFALGFPLGARVVVDVAIGDGNLRVLTLALVALGGGFILSTAAAVAQDRLTATTGSRLVQRVRGGVFGDVLSAPDRLLATHAPSEILSRFANDVAAVEAAVVRGVPTATLHSLLAAASVALLFVTDWRLGIACTAASPLVLVGPRLLGRRAVDASELKKSGEAQALAHLHTTVHGWPVLHAFRLRSAVLHRYRETSERLRSSSARANFLAALLGRISTLGVMLLVLIAVALGSALALRGQITVGALLAAVALLFNLEAAAVGLTEAVPLLLQGAAGWRRIVELGGGRGPRYSSVPAWAAAADEGTQVAPLPFEGSIRLQGLTLSAADGRAIVDGVTAELDRGQLIVLLGASGSGKTSLIELLVGVRRPTAGHVLVDGTTLADLNRERFLETVGVAFQTPFLLPGSVADNIRMGRPAASDEDVAAAARAAHVYDAVAALPAGLDTQVTGPLPLSGGEVQRIALARALLRRPALLLLDEATGALDPATEAAVAATIRSLAPPATVLWATHHVGNAAAADRVLVMEGGRLMPEGDHRQLLAQEGGYARLWQAQQGFRVSEDGSSASVDGARLADIPLLATLPRRYLREIAGRFVTRVFEPGIVIVQQGGPGSHFYLIARGQVEVLRGDPARPVTTLDTGAFFGEVSLLTGETANATVRSIGRTVCLALSRERFHELLAETPRLEAAIRPVMQARRHRSDEGADRRSGSSAP